jgi:hypothetical protein
VLCAKDGCDHLDCDGGPFLVVLLEASHDGNDEDDDVVMHIWARWYSLETGAWSAATTRNVINQLLDDRRPSLLIGDALYFISACGEECNILKYDLHKHELSMMDLLGQFSPILIKGDDGGLAIAVILHNCIFKWSWQVGINGVGEWVKYRVMELDNTLLTKGCYPPDLFCMVEGTNTVLIVIKQTGTMFALNLKSKQWRKIGEKKTTSMGPSYLT